MTLNKFFFFTTLFWESSNILPVVVQSFNPVLPTQRTCSIPIHDDIRSTFHFLQTSYLAVKKINDENSENPRHDTITHAKTKKRRFAQEIGSLPFPSKSSVIRSTATPLVPQSEPRDEMKGTKSKRNDKNLNEILKNRKSIDELEEIMLKRFGTNPEKWTASTAEYEFVDDGNIYKEEATTKNTSYRLPSTNMEQKRRTRSKPVFDPWQKEDFHREKREENNVKANDNDGKGTLKSFTSIDDSSKNVFDRVRKNQERLRTSREKSYTTKSNKDKSQIDDIDDIDSFDDEEDGDDWFQDDEYSRDRGNTKKTPSGQMEPLKTSRDRVDSKGGTESFFFFNSNASETIDANEEPTAVNDKKTKQMKTREPKEVQHPALLDDKGNEIYLTLQQAERSALRYLNTEDKSDEIIPSISEVSWKDVGIVDSQMMKNLSKMNCAIPLPVQVKTAPAIISKTDVLVSTHTGSGKTLSYLAPLLQSLILDESNDENEGVKAIIIAPGRELASQIVAVARDLLQGTGFTVMLAIGGTPFSRNLTQIRKNKPDFLVGTPGRIAELIVGKPGEKQGKLKISSLKTVVLDECDALIEYEPHRDPTFAFMDVVKRRHRDSLQSILCSATATDMLGKNSLEGFLRSGYKHAESDESDNLITSGLTGTEQKRTTRVSRTAIHGVIQVPHKRFVLDSLKKLLYTNPQPQQALIFVDNSRRVGIIVEKLAEMGIIAAPLHGGIGSEKGDRAEVNKLLREGLVGIVVATEMAARGIDAPYLTHVINLDLPTDASHYAHRAGRCGRGGRPGVVVNFAVGPREKGVPFKFASALDIDMHVVQPRSERLVILDKQE